MRMPPHPFRPKLLTRALRSRFSCRPQRVTPWVAALVIGSCIVSQLSAAPPARPEIAAQQRSGFGNLLFGLSQKTRQVAPAPRSQRTSTITVFHPEYRTFAPPSQASLPPPPVSTPTQAPEIEIRPAIQKGVASTDSRSRLTIPVSPTGPSVRPPAPIETTPPPANPGMRVSTEPPRSPVSEMKPAAKALPTVLEDPKYAKPVMGRPGFVRPPGSTDPGYILDVQGIATGSKARDPRTGLVFLVPPMF